MRHNDTRFWKVMGGRLKRPRTLHRRGLIDYAIKHGFDANAHNWIIPTDVVVAFLRGKGYTVDFYLREED